MQTISPITEQLIDLAIAEDLCAGDFTTDAIFDDKSVSHGKLIAKSDLVLCGQFIFTYIVEKIESRALGIYQPVTVTFFFDDGARVKKGDIIAEFSGSTQILLKAERTALNFLQHLSFLNQTFVNQTSAIVVNRIGNVDFTQNADQSVVIQRQRAAIFRITAKRN